MVMERGTQSGAQSGQSQHTDVLDVRNVKSILTAAGWQNVEGCEVVPGFAIGQSHSPTTPVSKFQSALRYNSPAGSGLIRTPLSQIISYSEQSAENEQNAQLGQSQKAGSFARS